MFVPGARSGSRVLSCLRLDPFDLAQSFEPVRRVRILWVALLLLQDRRGELQSPWLRIKIGVMTGNQCELMKHGAADYASDRRY